MPISSPASTAQAGRGPFAVLRRAKNVKNASDEEREALLGDAERLETWCANLVLGAIVLEAVVWASPLGEFLFKLGNFIADAAVAIGIYGEVRFGHVAGDVLKMRLAEAIERAANAELETEKLRAQFAWRRLSAAQAAAISEVLKKEGWYCVEITFPFSDPEANVFAHEIGAVFSKNRWGVGYVASSGPEVVFGIRIPMYSSPPQLLELGGFCRTVQMAIAHAGIDFTPHPAPEWGMSVPSGSPITRPCPTIYVGTKPMRKLD